jgi:hypothetical protein
MSNKNLFKEAIADAKAVREAALANAKAALEEALTPRLQSMLSTKLNEMEYENENEMEEGFTTSHGDDSDENLDFNLEETDELEEDFDLSEILAELNEAEEKEKKKEETEENEEEMPEDIDSLKALIQDLISQEMGNGGGAEMHAEPDADNMGGPSDHDADNADEEIDLEELLAELDEMGNDDDQMEEGAIGDAFKKLGKGISKQTFLMGAVDKVDANKQKIKTSREDRQKDWDSVNGDKEALRKMGYVFSTPHKGGGGFGTQQAIGESEINEYMSGQESLIDLGKWALENFPTVAKQLGQDAVQIGGAITGLATVGGMALTGALGTLISKAKAYMKSKKSSSSDKGEMNEAIRTINTLRSELNEVNLLNAKLLYVNKIFKAKNLTESQKLKVIASFDKATTAKEAKVVYESLNSTLTTATPKQAIKESLGFASRAAGVAPRKAIVETNDAITRMQKLANIIK